MTAADEAVAISRDGRIGTFQSMNRDTAITPHSLNHSLSFNENGGTGVRSVWADDASGFCEHFGVDFYCVGCL